MPCLRQRADELASALAFAVLSMQLRRQPPGPTYPGSPRRGGYRRRGPRDGLESLRRANFERLAKHLHRYRPPSSGTLSMLEVGCAHGWFLEANAGYYTLLASSRISQSLRKPPPGACQFAEGISGCPRCKRDVRHHRFQRCHRTYARYQRRACFLSRSSESRRTHRHQCAIAPRCVVPRCPARRQNGPARRIRPAVAGRPSLSARPLPGYSDDWSAGTTACAHPRRNHITPLGISDRAL